MLDHTDPVASVIPAMSLDSPSDNAMTALSRLALGPVNTDYYLKVFERFDDTGRTTTTWNWAACLCTLNWMLFRQLWGAALVYVAAAEGLALIVFGVGRSFLHWPMGIELGVLGAFALLAFAVPGLYGNAILHADIRKRIARALAASRTLPEACALLEKQASSRKRLQMLVLANGGLGLAALIACLALPPSDVKPLALEPAVTVAQATAAAQPAPAIKPVGALPATHADGAPTPPPAPANEAPASPVVPEASGTLVDYPGWLEHHTVGQARAGAGSTRLSEQLEIAERKLDWKVRFPMTERFMLDEVEVFQQRGGAWVRVPLAEPGTGPGAPMTGADAE